jgi:hypothetical protein
MEVKDWFLIVSTALGPILAVQAQKSVEVLRERRNRKFWVEMGVYKFRPACNLLLESWNPCVITHK